MSFGQSKSRWEKAQSLNTITGYEDFIEKYPNGKYTLLAKRKADSLSFSEASKTNTINSYSDYNKSFPEGIYFRVAKNKKDSINFFNAKNDNDITGLQKCIDSESIFSNSAKRIVDSLRFMIINRDDMSSLLLFLQTEPEPKYINQLINDFTEHVYYNQCVNYQRLRDMEYYKRRFPNGRHENQVIDLQKITIPEVKKNLNKALTDLDYRNSTGFKALINSFPHEDIYIPLTDIKSLSAIHLESFKLANRKLSYYGNLASMQLALLYPEVISKFKKLGAGVDLNNMQKYLMIFDNSQFYEVDEKFHEFIIIIEIKIVDVEALKIVYSVNYAYWKNFNQISTIINVFDIPIEQKNIEFRFPTSFEYHRYDLHNTILYTDSSFTRQLESTYFILNLPKKCTIKINESYKTVLKIDHNSMEDYGYEIFNIEQSRTITSYEIKSNYGEEIVNVK